MKPPPLPERPVLRDLLFVGLNAGVVALDKRTGGEVWRTLLRTGMTSGHRFVTLLLEDGVLFAHTIGEAFALDASSGRILWKNELRGMGYGLAILAVEGMYASPVSVEEQQVADQQASETHHSSI